MLASCWKVRITGPASFLCSRDSLTIGVWRATWAASITLGLSSDKGHTGMGTACWNPACSHSAEGQGPGLLRRAIPGHLPGSSLWPGACRTPQHCRQGPGQGSQGHNCTTAVHCPPLLQHIPTTHTHHHLQSSAGPSSTRAETQGIECTPKEPARSSGGFRMHTEGTPQDRPPPPHLAVGSWLAPDAAWAVTWTVT